MVKNLKDKQRKEKTGVTKIKASNKAWCKRDRLLAKKRVDNSSLNIDNIKSIAKKYGIKQKLLTQLIRERAKSC